MKGLLTLLCFPLLLSAQEAGLDELAGRLSAFGKAIPQEKVYVHMDNTCYFQGDTIWFTAYTRQTNTDKPSEVSGVLYVELLNNDGYLVERKLIEMKQGRGYGFFSLNNQIQYSGFYELRAYTKWQLNWGRYEHKHPRSFGSMFRDKEKEREYFRDYDKLYSRVFPVYDRPLTPGDYTRDMTLRVLRREFRTDADKRELKLSVFPEGGNLVAGIENRVAFEAAMTDGEEVEGFLLVGDERIKAQHRGRGVFTIVPKRGNENEVTFEATNGERVTVRLPVPEESGVAIMVTQTKDSVSIATCLAGLYVDSLAFTIMHEGRVEEFHALSAFLSSSRTGRLTVPLCKEPGVHQVTVFDSRGRVYADRLFFVTKPGLSEPTLAIQGMKAMCSPYEKHELTIRAQKGSAPISLAVRDAYQSDPVFDNGNIMTEMLLCSELKGFIPNPGWYFEKDDEQHRKGLDLLMMTQGWRRFVWRDMAIKGNWDITWPNEKSPVMMGKVSFNPNRVSWEGIRDIRDEKGNILTHDYKHILELAKKELPSSLLIHSELVHLPTNETAISETPYSGGIFNIPFPKFYGNSVFFLSAADTATWGKSKRDYAWIQMVGNDEEYPLHIMRNLHLEETDFRAYISWPYPRFVKPYCFYQTHLQPAASGYGVSLELLSDSSTSLREVSVTAHRRSRLKGLNYAYPAFVMDAYDTWNAIEDAGVPIFDYKSIGKQMVRVFMNDYGMNEEHDGNGDDRIYTSIGPRSSFWGMGIPYDSLYHPKNLQSVAAKDADMSRRDEFQEVFGGRSIDDPRSMIDKYVVYTDYQPRLEGSSRYQGANRPETLIMAYLFQDDSRRAVYRDRRYILDGFSYPAEFYSPDYSKHRLPDGQKDYRRTLYWNPNLQLDENGEASVTFYTGSRQTTLSIEAEGQAPDGTLLWNRQQNE